MNFNLFAHAHAAYLTGFERRFFSFVCFCSLAELTLRGARELNLNKRINTENLLVVGCKVIHYCFKKIQIFKTKNLKPLHKFLSFALICAWAWGSSNKQTNKGHLQNRCAVMCCCKCLNLKFQSSKSWAMLYTTCSLNLAAASSCKRLSIFGIMLKKLKRFFKQSKLWV